MSVAFPVTRCAPPYAAAAAAAPAHQRHLRIQAVVDALRDHANRGQGPVRALVAREQAQGNVTRVVPFWVFNGLALTATEPVIRRLAARADVWEIRPDAEIPPPPPVQSAAAPSPAATASVWNLDKIRAPEVWAIDPAYTGSGQVVGSFDTGVDITHPDLLPRYRGNHAISWFDPYGEHLSPFDFNGHGTHTTGTAVGGAASGLNIGVAPGARDRGEGVGRHRARLGLGVSRDLPVVPGARRQSGQRAGRGQQLVGLRAGRLHRRVHGRRPGVSRGRNLSRVRRRQRRPDGGQRAQPG
jgi:subtilisin family serine protease